MTNCIAEIPQDIKVELNDGNLTLKAGSKVWVPDGLNKDGSKKFTVIEVGEDVLLLKSLVATYTTGNYTWCFNPTLNKIQGGNNVYNQVQSGSTIVIDDVNSGYVMFYDVVNNVIKYTADKGASYETGYSLPFCITSLTNGTGITNIDQVFNGFGFIDSTVFALPSVKAIAPNGRNADGSLNNTKITINNVEVKTFDSQTYGDFNVCVNNLGYLDHVLHRTLNLTEGNLFESQGVIFTNRTKVGTFRINSSADNGKIAWFKSEQPFTAVGKSDGTFLSAQSMPSSKYIDLTLGASGQTYTAPANGWFFIGKDVTRNAEQYCSFVVNNDCYQVSCSPTGGNRCILIAPVQKGQEVAVYYTAAGATAYFRFIYAEGEFKKAGN